MVSLTRCADPRASSGPHPSLPGSSVSALVLLHNISVVHAAIRPRSILLTVGDPHLFPSSHPCQGPPCRPTLRACLDSFEWAAISRNLLVPGVPRAGGSRYLAPELLVADDLPSSPEAPPPGGRLTPKADVYALGVILRQFLPLFEAERARFAEIPDPDADQVPDFVALAQVRTRITLGAPLHLDSITIKTPLGLIFSGVGSAVLPSFFSFFFFPAPLPCFPPLAPPPPASPSPCLSPSVTRRACSSLGWGAFCRQDLVARMTEARPALRLTMTEILLHDLFACTHTARGGIERPGHP